jgi:hypothetical protein
MRIPKSILKIGSVASALLLVGGFVAYRAGALEWLMEGEKPAEEPMLTMSMEEAAEYLKAQEGVDMTFMASSKSIAPLIRPKPKSPASQPPASGPTAPGQPPTGPDLSLPKR